MTTVGEALNRRSDLQKRIAQLEERLRTSVLETVTEALARRDVLALRAAALRSVIRAATDRGPFGRYGRAEIRMVRQIGVSDVQSEVDARAKEQRELDNNLQEHNWTTQLIE
jgi:hypothetical protein